MNILSQAYFSVKNKVKGPMPDWLFVLWAGGTALLSYSLVYALRKPFTAAEFEGLQVCGMDYKIAVSIIQLLGYVCAKMLGIKIAENFDAPYFSKSIAEYWRRWHISLGAWFRDYVYYPILRGKNSEKIRKFFKNKNNKFLANNMPTVFALSILWILIGFWHGSTWAFILYGMYHGSIIIISTLLAPIYDKFYKKFPN